MFRQVLTFALTCATVIAPAYGAPIVFSQAAANAAGIQSTVDAFRAALGANNGTAGTPFLSGRREINWDAVPDNLAAPNNLPANQFAARGVLFGTPGTGFQVSADSSNPTSTPILFDNLFAGNSSLFATFSAERLFTSLGSVITDVNFIVPGSANPASSSAFGVVFTDVDLPNLTSLTFFDQNNVSLGTFFAPNVAGNKTFSFLGVQFNSGERVSRVRISAGDLPLNSPTCSDCVAMDDFIFAEPQAVPEPVTMLLVACGVAGLMIGRRSRTN